jgi:hypothetical protein
MTSLADGGRAKSSSSLVAGDVGGGACFGCGGYAAEAGSFDAAGADGGDFACVIFPS